MEKRKIKIAGAGLSGLTAAIILAKEGCSVEVYDIRKESGSRFHGDFQGLENWTKKENVLDEFRRYGIEIDFVNHDFDNIKLANDSLIKSFCSPEPFFYLVKRGSGEDTLDTALKNQALRLGIKINANSKCDDPDIIATGPRAGEQAGIVKGIRFKTNSQDVALGLVDNKIALGGYAYLLVASGEGCICTVVMRDFDSAQAYLEETIKSVLKYQQIEMKDVKSVGGVGNYYRRAKFRQGKAIVVGEAAGLQDYLFGFGMRLAIRSGYLAARSIIEGFDYEEAAVKEFLNLQKAGVVNRWLFEKYLKRGAPLVGSKFDNLLQSLRSIYNFNLGQRLVYPFILRKSKD